MVDWTNLISAIIGGIIGTYLGAFFIYKKQQERYKNIRKIAIRALKIFKKYQRKTYHDALNEFNASLNLTEKRAILVVLHKIGIPITAESSGKFNINEVLFSKNIIENNNIDNMVFQIESGNCDHIFFEDPDEYFNKNVLRNYKRHIATKYIKNIFSKSRINKDGNIIYYPEKWWEQFSLGEFSIVLVLRDKLSDSYLFEKDTCIPKSEKIEEILKEINIGLWDTYLEWSYEAFSNVQIQKNFANVAMNAIAMQQQNNVSISHKE